MTRDRLRLALDLRGALGDRTVVRGGYGVFYEAEGTSGRLNFNFLPFSLSEGVNATANVVPTRTLANYFLGVPFGASVGAVGWTPLPLEADMGYDQRWNVGVQQEIPGRISVELNYVGTKGSNQQQAEPINIPEPGPGNIQARRPYPRFGNLNINSQALSSEYHALQAKLQKRLAGGLWYLASYTFSRSLTTAPAPGIGGNFTYDTGPAPFDIPHILALSFGAELPFGNGKRFLSGAGQLANALAGGWQAQSIINYRSGLPFTPTISRDVANTGATDQRPNRIGSGKLENPTLDAWFDKSAFVEPAAVHLRKFRQRHSPGRSPVECGCLAVQEIQSHRILVAGIQGGSVQPPQLCLLRLADAGEQGRRYRRRRPDHQHVE